MIVVICLLFGCERHRGLLLAQVRRWAAVRARLPSEVCARRDPQRRTRPCRCARCDASRLRRGSCPSGPIAPATNSAREALTVAREGELLQARDGPFQFACAAGIAPGLHDREHAVAVAKSDRHDAPTVYRSPNLEVLGHGLTELGLNHVRIAKR